MISRVTVHVLVSSKCRPTATSFWASPHAIGSGSVALGTFPNEGLDLKVGFTGDVSTIIIVAGDEESSYDLAPVTDIHSFPLPSKSL